MLHFLLGLLITFIFISGNAWSVCNPSDSKAQDHSEPCYRELNSLKMKTQKIVENEFIEYEVTPMKVLFKNISTPKLYQFMYVDINDDQSQSEVYMASFVCDGETPVGGDALMDSMKKVAVTDNLNLTMTKKNKAKIYDHFLELYESLQADKVFETNKDNVYVPNLIAQSTNLKEKRAYSAYFSRTNSSINGCSKKFLNTMNDYLIENITKNRQFRDIILKKKKFSQGFLMKWVF